MAALLVLAACNKRGSQPDGATPEAVGQGQSHQAMPSTHQGGYRLPFDGQWLVFGTHYENDPSNPQAFAVDIAPHPIHRGRTKPETHGCWGKPILADGPGVIALAVDGVYDNPETGRANKYDMHGNYVVIDHRNGEFSLFAHLQQGSVRVRPGQVVQMGDILGLCGNSGRSFRPHLHWQVMSHPYTQHADGLPIRHQPYLSNGRSTTGRLEKGQEVRMP